MSKDAISLLLVLAIELVCVEVYIELKITRKTLAIHVTCG